MTTAGTSGHRGSGDASHMNRQKRGNRGSERRWLCFLQLYGCNVLNLGNGKIISVHAQTARQIIKHPNFKGDVQVPWPLHNPPPLFLLCGGSSLQFPLQAASMHRNRDPEIESQLRWKSQKSSNSNFDTTSTQGLEHCTPQVNLA